MKKKLSLNKKTVAHLDSRELNTARGGANTYNTCAMTTPLECPTDFTCTDPVMCQCTFACTMPCPATWDCYTEDYTCTCN